MNSTLVDELFDENNFTRPIGDILRFLKDEESGANTRTVFCIGDPAIKMALPKPEVLLTNINGVSVNEWLENGNVLKALDKVTMAGKVVDGITGMDLSGYKGEAAISVFDKDLERSTLGNDRITENGELITIDFTESGSLIFRGLAVSYTHLTLPTTPYV